MKDYKKLYEGIGDRNRASYFDYLNKLTERPKIPARRVHKSSSTPLKEVSKEILPETERPTPAKWRSGQ